MEQTCYINVVYFDSIAQKQSYVFLLKGQKKGECFLRDRSKVVTLTLKRIHCIEFCA